ncbi:MAG: signal peptidase II [Verrucomicrobia bacterium]|nr:signal peptidase II [Verrucomicrobiota bacterium]MBU4246816.1 signal peptidase II [Verrucomicrobiota bacterium]MBU4291810.1 signal peptidase II [Verrucomicrobiota bacterium]MBU4428235.1 signal peptidase II [Verrucomicrobiota bacterium]MCG2680809.1 signal peptidase II [Kiritimatiellia bacterium]
MIAVIIGFIIVLLDQAAKVAIRQTLMLGESRPVIEGYFNLTYLRNTGAVWGIFQYQNEWLILLSLLVLLLIVVFYRWLVDQRGVHRLAMGFMIGGIVGNLIDRIKLGWVTDFLDFYWQTSHWPSFNIADSAICVGVVIYLASSFWLSSPVSGEPEKKRQQDAVPSTTD